MSERVEFEPPKGVVPEDVKPGDTFDLVSTYRLKDDGEICLVQIGDQKMPGYEEDEYADKSQEHRKDYSDVAGQMQAAMAQGMGGAAGAPGAGGGGYG